MKKLEKVKWVKILSNENKNVKLEKYKKGKHKMSKNIMKWAKYS